MDSSTLYFVIAVVSFFVGVFITRWIFGIDKIIENLNKQTGYLEEQNQVITAQLHLLSSIAEKAGVPLEDINDVTKDFGIEFSE